MRVLYCASEAAPLVKIGGLGDVAGSLPKALARHGVDVALCIPHYQLIDDQKFGITQIGQLSVTIGEGKSEIVTVGKTVLPDSAVPVLLLGNQTYLAQGGKVAYENSVTETDRFAFFQKAIIALLSDLSLESQIGGPFDIIHCNDWHTSLLPILSIGVLNPRPKFILTIHNAAYHGVNDGQMPQRIGLSQAQVAAIASEPNHDIDYLKQGIRAVDKINTVSENYAKELLTTEFGEGLETELSKRQADLSGILNGIDYETWNPAEDQKIAKTYRKEDLLEVIKAAKAENKRMLQAKVGLPQTATPLLGFVGRIEPKQKGIDLICGWLEKGIGACQLVVLGTGDHEWEERLRSFAQARPDAVSAQNFFSEDLAHMMYAGCDYILMPSKFEPGGLPQMIAQHYGTPPIVHSVGGLKDTVTDEVTGFRFDEYSGQAMAHAIQQAILTYSTPLYWQIVQQGMAQDYSWHTSAEKYLALYQLTLGSTAV